MNISNQEFLHAIFGEDFIWVHVTDFFHDPGNTFSEVSKKAWRGDYYVNYKLHQYANQYFTISLFNSTPDAKSRRRKELFKATYCIVIDDVCEKINPELLFDKPAPSWVLETSPGSQQWGYILQEPCTDRVKVEALLQGLVKKLCPNGIDSGMLGVTRYVRLPEGWNTKEAKVRLNKGELFKCQLLIWQPEVKHSIDVIIDTFNVNVAVKENSYFYPVDNDRIFFDINLEHPIWEAIDLHGVQTAYQFDIRCPWIDEHTNQEDTGTTLFINADGTIGFKCHHGHCANRTAVDLLEWLEINHNDVFIKCKEKRNELKKLYKVKQCPILFAQ